MQALDLHIDGMSCAACVTRVEKALGKVMLVEQVQVNLASNMARVQHKAQGAEAAQTLLQNALLALRKAGYGAHLLTQNEPSTRKETRKAFYPVLGAMFLSLPLMLPMVAMVWGQHLMLPLLWQLALASFVQFVFGWRFYVGAWHALRHGTGSMDQLVALGTTAAWALSVWNMGQAHGLAHGVDVYFESSAMVISLVLMGKWLEHGARAQAGQALVALQGLQVRTVHCETPHGLLPLAREQMQLGDVFIVRPGERVALDGVVLEGHSACDESMLTGEALPVAKQAGDPVTGGTLNGQGLLRVRVTAVGANTVMAQMLEAVMTVQSAKAPIARLADRIAAVFVPVVLGVALITGLLWWLHTGHVSAALIHAVAVLVIACPCAMGLATPAAIMVGTGLAARHGILIRDPLVLERAHQAQLVAFDKTGTLTLGQPQCVALLDATAKDTFSPDAQLWSLVRSLQQGSSHPLAQAFAQKFDQNADQSASKSLLLPVRDAQSHPGKGQSAQLLIDGQWQRFAIGHAAWAERLGAQASQALLDAHQHWLAQGCSVSWLWRDEQPRPQVLALLAFSDTVRPEARVVVAALQGQGLAVWMLSGDNLAAARHIGHSVGLDDAHIRAGLLPQDKLKILQDFQHQGVHAVMVGDGVNDAAALAAAHIGMAMGQGSEVATHSASITLLNNDLRAVLQALALLSQTHRTIQLNLFWAFAYNVVGIPLAAIGWLSPVLAAAAMALSSVSVLLNALALRGWFERYKKRMF
jgi:P-type Cu+ transporter